MPPLAAVGTTIEGTITDDQQPPGPIANATVAAQLGVNRAQAASDAAGAYVIPVANTGNYTVSVTADGHIGRERQLNVVAGVNRCDFTLERDNAFAFRTLLNDPAFNIETPISRVEAQEAVTLFSVVSLMLAGSSRRTVGGQEKNDALGVLTLYYGLQDKSISDRLVLQNENRFFADNMARLRELADKIEQKQSDIDFLMLEAKRQFNLGRSNGVPGNTGFPPLFRRLVDIAADPLLSLDLRTERQSQFTDKEKVSKAIDLLAELKSVLLQMVRTLSRTGTGATTRVNQEWSRFEAQAMQLLNAAAQDVVTSDFDNKNSWAVLAALSQKDRDAEVAPYVVLGRHGGRLLAAAMEIYDAIERNNQLESVDPDTLIDLFQQQAAGAAAFWTTRLRADALVIKRYPLPNWG